MGGYQLNGAREFEPIINGVPTLASCPIYGDIATCITNATRITVRIDPG